MQEINMDNINIDDYYVSVEYLDNFTDNNIDNWIENGNKEKIMNKLSQIYKSGRSFTSNGYQATSTDAVFTPFYYQMNGEGVIEYLETRHIFYFPALFDVVVKQSVPEKVINDNKTDLIEPKEEKTNQKNSKKRKLPTENNKELVKTEIKSPEKKKRKCAQNSNGENHSKEEMKNEEPVKLESKSPVAKKELTCNGNIDLDNQVNSTGNINNDNKQNITLLETPEITKKHKKKSKEKNRKSDSETPINHQQTTENEKPNSDLNGEVTKKHKKKSKKSVDGEIIETKDLPQTTEPMKINGENVVSNGCDHLNENPEKKKKKKKKKSSTELTEELVKQEKIVEEKSEISPKLENLSELEVKKQKKHKKRKHSEEVIVEIKKEKIHKKSKKQTNPDN